MLLFAEDKVETEVTVEAHGNAAEATHHDTLTELETDDEVAVLKILMIPRCSNVAMMDQLRFLVNRILLIDFFSFFRLRPNRSCTNLQ